MQGSASVSAPLKFLCHLLSSSLLVAALPRERGGHKTPPLRLISPSRPLFLTRGQGDLSRLGILGAAYWGRCSLLLSKKIFFCLHCVFLQEADAQTQRNTSLSLQWQKFQEQWCILECRKLSGAVSHLSEHLFPCVFLSIYLSNYLKVLTLGKTDAHPRPSHRYSHSLPRCWGQRQVSGSETVVSCLLNGSVTPRHQPRPGQPCMAGRTV